MNKVIYYIIGVLFVFTVFSLWYFSAARSPFDLDAFAKCLSSKNVTMYGADWCPHCRNEKFRFGSAFRFVSYVECSKNPQRCLALGIDAYPTWIFKDGKKIEGDLSIQKLSEESSCSLSYKRQYERKIGR